METGMFEAEMRMEVMEAKEVVRRRRANAWEQGFTLMELLIVMSIILIIMAFAIGNYGGMIRHANETSAIQSLRAINNAEIQYHTTYPSAGFACSLGSMGGLASAGNPTATAAQLLPADLTTGQKSGYTFNIVNCSKVNINNQDMITSFEATAVPQAIGKTGNRGFCMDVNGYITADPAGGTNCTQPIQ